MTKGRSDIRVSPSSARFALQQEILWPVDLALLVGSEDLVIDNIMQPAGLRVDAIKIRVADDLTAAWKKECLLDQH